MARPAQREPEQPAVSAARAAEQLAGLAAPEAVQRALRLAAEPREAQAALQQREAVARAQQPAVAGEQQRPEEAARQASHPAPVQRARWT